MKLTLLLRKYTFLSQSLIDLRMLHFYSEGPAPEVVLSCRCWWKTIVYQLTRNEVCREMDLRVNVMLVETTETTARECPTVRYVYILFNEPNS